MPYSKYKVDLSEKAKKARTVHDGHTGKIITFDSAVEKRYYDEVIVPGFKSGAIIDYDLQRRYELIPAFVRMNGEKIRKIQYVADYWIKYSDGHIEVKDIKGSGYLVDPIAKIKRKLIYYYYPDLDFQWICFSKGKWINWDKYMAEKRAVKKERKDKE